MSLPYPSCVPTVSILYLSIIAHVTCHGHLIVEVHTDTDWAGQVPRQIGGPLLGIVLMLAESWSCGKVRNS